MNNSILSGIFFIAKMIVLTPGCQHNHLCNKKTPALPDGRRELCTIAYCIFG